MAHHGEVINSIIKRTNFTKEELADRMGKNRRTIYHWIDKPFLKPAIIDAIGKALNVDMYAAAPGVFNSAPVYDGERKFEPSIPNMEGIDWKDKYIIVTEQLLGCKDQLQLALMRVAELEHKLTAS